MFSRVVGATIIELSSDIPFSLRDAFRKKTHLLIMYVSGEKHKSTNI